MVWFFFLFNSFIPFNGQKEKNTQSKLPFSFFSLYCYLTQPITHMRTQEISKDLYGNPFHTFSRKELVSMVWWHLRREPVCVSWGHKYTLLLLHEWGSLQALEIKARLIFAFSLKVNICKIISVRPLWNLIKPEFTSDCLTQW